MKRLILTLLAIVALSATQAQQVIYPRDGRMDGYWYPYWYDECIWYSDTCPYFRTPTEYIMPNDPWMWFESPDWWDTINPYKSPAKRYHTDYPMAITGLGVWQGRPQEFPIDHTWYPLGTEPARPEYVIIIQQTADSLIFLDTVRWDTAAPKTLMLPRNRDSLGLTDTAGVRVLVTGYMPCYLYEVNLPNPVVVDSDFWLVGTLNSNEVDLQKRRFVTNAPKRYVCFECRQDNPDCGRLPLDFRYFHFESQEFEPRLGEVKKVYGNIQVKAGFVNLDMNVNDPEWGSTCPSGPRSRDTYQTITATHNYGYRFCCWSDGDTNNPRLVYMTQDTSFTAIFVPIGFNSLTVQSNNDDYGQVAGDAILETGDSAYISATPYFGHRFRRWNDGDTNNPRLVHVTCDTSFTAIFQYIGIYSVTLHGSDSVFVEVSGGGTYEGGDSVVISSRFVPFNSELDTLSPYWLAFRTWDDSVRVNPRKICVTHDTSLTAIYVATAPMEIPNTPSSASLFTLTPNPTTGEVTVTLGQPPLTPPEGGERLTLTIHDAAGNEVMHKEFLTPHSGPDPESQFPSTFPLFRPAPTS